MGRNSRLRRTAREVRQTAPAQSTPKQRRIMRMIRWIMAHKKVSATVAAGLVLGSVAVERVYHHYNPRRADSAVILGKHETLTDGRRIAEQLRGIIQHKKVAVIAMENMGATAAENHVFISQIEERRRAFVHWRTNAHPTEQQVRQMAESFAAQVTGSTTYTPIIAEAYVQGLPVRFVENCSPIQVRRFNELQARNDQEWEKAVNAPTLGQGFQHMEKANTALEQLTQERNEEMREEVDQLKEEFRGQGLVVSWVGQGHFSLAGATGSEKVSAVAVEQVLVLDPEAESGASPHVHAGRTLVMAYLDGIARAQPQRKTDLLRLAERVKRLNERDLDELDRAVGTKIGNLRAQTIASTLSEWMKAGR